MKWPAAALAGAAVACSPSSSKPPADTHPEDRLELRHEPLPIRPIATGEKGLLPSSASSTVTLTLTAQVAPPVVGGTPLHASSIGRYGTKVYISYHRAGAGYAGAVDVVDVGDPQAPVLLSSHAIAKQDVNAVTADGQWVALALSSDAFPFAQTAAVGTLAHTDGVISGSPARLIPMTSYVGTSVAVDGGRVLATSGDAGGAVVAVDPTDASVLASSALEDPRSIGFEGSTFAVHRGDRVEIIDGTTLASLRQLPFVRGSDEDARSEVELVGGKAFVTAGSHGVHVLDTSDGTLLDSIAVPNHVDLGLLASESVANGLAVAGNLLFLAQGGGGLQVAFTDSDPAGLPSNSLTPYASLSRVIFPDTESANAVAVTDNVLVVASGAGGVRFVTIGNFDDTVVHLASAQFGSVPTAPVASLVLTSSVTAAPVPIDRVEFYAGSGLLGSDDTPPYELELTNVTGEYYDFSARAIFEGGHAETSATHRLDLDGVFARVSFGMTSDPYFENAVPVGFFDNRGDLPAGYEVDSGQTYRLHASGLTYGWNSDRTSRNYDFYNRNLPDRRYIAGVQLRWNGTRWELGVPNGHYRVRSVAGLNPWNFQPQTLDVVVDGNDPLFRTTTTNEAFFVESTLSGVFVGDGRLNVRKVSGSSDAALYFVEVFTDGQDYQPPSPPSDVSAEFVFANSMILNWVPGVDNTSVAHYRVLRDGVDAGSAPGSRHFVHGLDLGATYDFSVIAVDGFGNESEPATYRVTTSGDGLLEAPSATGPIVVDGVGDEADWTSLAGSAIDNVIGDPLVDPIPSPADSSGSVKARWDADHLYVLIEVEDDHLQTDDMTAVGTGVSNGDDDTIELSFDLADDRTLGLDTDDRTLRFGLSSASASDLDLDADGNRSAFSVALGHYATAVTATGWTIEMALPWTVLDQDGSSASLGLTPVADLRLGFEVHILDDDDGGGRDSLVAWAGYGPTDGAWTTSQVLGTLILR